MPFLLIVGIAVLVIGALYVANYGFALMPRSTLPPQLQQIVDGLPSHTP